jgi:hypothetical protein
MVQGRLSFSITKEPQSSLSFQELDWKGDLDGEILALKKVISDQSELYDVLNIVIQLDGYQKKEKSILTIQFGSDDVVWKPA